MECQNHPLITASGNCASCGKPFCQLCLISHNGEEICERCKAALPQKPLHSWDEKEKAPLAEPEAVTPVSVAADIQHALILEPDIAPPPLDLRSKESYQNIGSGKPAKVSCKEADTALVLSVLGIFCCCGFLTGPLAIYFSRQATEKIRQNPHLAGKEKADAAMIIGVISIIQIILIIIFSWGVA